MSLTLALRSHLARKGPPNECVAAAAAAEEVERKAPPLTHADQCFSVGEAPQPLTPFSPVCGARDFKGKPSGDWTVAAETGPLDVNEL
ncbi:hypothetical protein BV898_06986 [Hypsibius exemplaris]|uniref:Uncharacterized protein n=1 Tax=Hypsibius exemplaris TaxID=2072580 RepID=A0A1W0WUQ1_HYPEX|nr:hypothetical protein BV898_06986 [Hypsibius exemplaris]